MKACPVLQARTLALLALPLLVVGLTFAACSSRSPSETSPFTTHSAKSQPNTEDGLKAGVKAAANALFSGDTPTAYQYFSKACREQVSYTDFASSLLLASAFFEGFMQMKLSDIEVTSVDVQNFSPGKGEARAHTRSKKNPDVSIDSPDDKFTAWIYEDSHWVQNDCSDMKFGSETG